MDHMRILGTEQKNYQPQNFSTQSQGKALSFRQILSPKLVKNSTILHIFFKNFPWENTQTPSSSLILVSAGFIWNLTASYKKNILTIKRCMDNFLYCHPIFFFFYLNRETVEIWTLYLTWKLCKCTFCTLVKPFTMTFTIHCDLDRGLLCWKCLFAQIILPKGTVLHRHISVFWGAGREVKCNACLK